MLGLGHFWGRRTKVLVVRGGNHEVQASPRAPGEAFLGVIGGLFVLYRGLWIPEKVPSISRPRGRAAAGEEADDDIREPVFEIVLRTLE